MWIFTTNGFVSLVQHPQEPEMLLVQTRTEEEMAAIVRVLDKIVGHGHRIEHVSDASCPWVVTATRRAVVQMIARWIENIDYTKFVRSVHFDFGNSPEFLLWMSSGGLQVARLNAE